MQLNFVQICLLLAGFALLPPQLSAQVYTPFFTENAAWTMKKVYPTIGPGDNTDYWTLYTQQDTIIAGYQYKQLAMDKLCRYLYAQGQVTILGQFQYDQFPIGAIREEDKKVYFYRYEIPQEWLAGGFESCLYSMAPGEEYLLYDYGAHQGDTVYFSNNRFTIINEPLNPIQNLSVQNVTPSNTFIFPHETGTWTDGIGSSYGLLGAYDSYLHYLVCFKMNDVPFVYTGECLPCPPPSASAAPYAGDGFKVFPNPGSGRIFIALDHSAPPYHIRVVTPFGQQLFEKTIDALNEVEFPDWVQSQGWVTLVLTDSEGKQFFKKLFFVSI